MSERQMPYSNVGPGTGYGEYGTAGHGYFDPPHSECDDEINRLSDALTAAPATIAQRDAQVAELTAALSEVSNLAGSGLMHNGTDGKNHYLSLIGLRADRALLARTPAAPEAEAYCTEDRHIVLPSGEACVCGENVTEQLL